MSDKSVEERLREVEDWASVFCEWLEEGAAVGSGYQVIVVCKNCKAIRNMKIPWGVSVRTHVTKMECGGCGCAYGWDGSQVWGTRMTRE